VSIEPMTVLERMVMLDQKYAPRKTAHSGARAEEGATARTSAVVGRSSIDVTSPEANKRSRAQRNL